MFLSYQVKHQLKKADEKTKQVEKVQKSVKARKLNTEDNKGKRNNKTMKKRVQEE